MLKYVVSSVNGICVLIDHGDVLICVCISTVETEEIYSN